MCGTVTGSCKRDHTLPTAKESLSRPGVFRCITGANAEKGLQGKMGSHQAALVCEAAVAAHKRVACYALPENLHAQHISYQLLRFLHGHQ